MAILKKQTFGSISTALALVLALAGLVAYHMNVGGAGYFQGAAVHQANTLMILSLVALLAVIILAQLELGKVADKVLDIVSGLLRIAAPAGLAAAAMQLISSRAQGLAFIYFSNEEVLAEVQTAANLSSASCAITNVVLLALAAVVGVVAAFFTLKKKNA